MGKALLLFIVFLPFAVFSQVAITGKVVSQAGNKPVAGATVFLSNTTIGSKAAPVNGIFALKNIRPGHYDLVIAAPGFAIYNQKIDVEEDNIALQTIRLVPRASVPPPDISSPENTPTVFNKNLALFKTEFLGASARAKDCKIENPGVLELHYDEHTSTLTASNKDFLVITNNALGYKIKYLIKNFSLSNGEERAVDYSGFVLFEEMKGTARQERIWQERRQEAYEGSPAHFLSAAVNDKLEQEGFKAMRLLLNSDRPADSLINSKLKIYLASANANPDSLNYWVKKKKLPKTADQLSRGELSKKDLISGPDDKGRYALGLKNSELYISYNKYHRINIVPVTKTSSFDNAGNTLVTFNFPRAIFDKNNVLLNKQALSYEGVWSRLRVADMLPVDFQPHQTAAITPDTVLVKNLTAKLTAYKGLNAEKTYLHFDKPYYAAGDTIYYKAYVTDIAKHELSRQSEVLNVELISSDDKISRWEKIQLTNGLGWGDFALPDTLKPGNYRVRAYTRLMRNAGDDTFEKTIPVGNAADARVPESGGAVVSNPQTTVSAVRPDVQFLPEGGYMLNGVKNKIAFKAVSPDGFGVNVKGAVTDNDHKTVASFAAAHLGMGAFEFVPVTGKTYKASITYADGSTGMLDLPKATDDGYHLNIDNSNPVAITISVASGKQNAPDKLSLVGQSGGVVYFSAKSTDSKQFDVTVSKSEFPTGIVQFTLFNANGLPLNERLVFVNNDDQLKLTVSSPQTAYVTRKKVTINLEAKNKAGLLTVGNFSVSVTDESKVPVNELNENTILSDLLLTSDLKGYVEKPNYYFTQISDKTNSDLDLLMLTQGYRRFEWKPVLSHDSIARVYQPEKALTISGTVKKAGKPLVNQKVTLFAKTGGTFFKDTTTNAEGKFAFKNLVFADSTKFVVQAKVTKGQDNVELTIDTPDNIPIADNNSRGPGGIRLTTNNAAEIDMSAYIQNAKQFSMELQKYGINQHPLLLREVNVKDKKGPDEFANSQNLNGKGSADQVITAKDLETLACGRLTECLRAKLNSNIVFKNGYMYVRKLSALDFTTTTEFKDPMKVIVDGTILEADWNLLDNINTADVESVEVLADIHSTAIYGTQGSAGLILITLKKGRKINNYYKYAPGVVTYAPKGFYIGRTFYAPQYDNPHTNEKIPDLRSTIYWNPTVVTGLDGKASFDFFNADGKGYYKVVVEGIDIEGRLGRQVYRYKVE
ncbi:MAG: carboxypeptidase regulatory-like domain-containing protein [Mucilaginibacter sp.]